MNPMPVIVRRLGLCDYQPVWARMRAFADNAGADTGEELWLLQHTPVYTLGRNGQRAHLLRDNGIPVVCSDRGGQITYHGPGQLVVYLLLNISRRRLGLRHFVRLLESAVIALLAHYGIDANGDVGAPGVYVNGAKIAALGLRLRRGWCYHGLSFNINMDLAPFADINPCGYQNLPVTHMAALCEAPPLTRLQNELADLLLSRLRQETAAAQKVRYG